MTHGPNDGPLMKWLLEHGQTYATPLRARQKIDNDLALFRKARDSNLAHGVYRVGMNIADFPAVLEFEEAECRRYKTTLSFLSPLLPANAYVREISGSTQTLTIGIDGAVPIVIAEGLVGSPAEAALELPAILQPVVAGRIIQSVTQFDEWTNFTLDSNPW